MPPPKSKQNESWDKQAADAAARYMRSQIEKRVSAAVPAEVKLAKRAIEDPAGLVEQRIVQELPSEVRTAYRIIKAKDPTKSIVELAVNKLLPGKIIIERIPAIGEKVKKYVFDPFIDGVTEFIKETVYDIDVVEDTPEAIWRRVKRTPIKPYYAPTPEYEPTVDYGDGYYPVIDNVPTPTPIARMSMETVRHFRTAIAYDGATNELWVNTRLANAESVSRMMSIVPTPTLIQYYE